MTKSSEVSRHFANIGCIIAKRTLDRLREDGAREAPHRVIKDLQLPCDLFPGDHHFMIAKSATPRASFPSPAHPWFSRSDPPSSADTAQATKVASSEARHPVLRAGSHFQTPSNGLQAPQLAYRKPSSR
jgi:hypothetical protein